MHNTTVSMSRDTPKGVAIVLDHPTGSKVLEKLEKNSRSISNSTIRAPCRNFVARHHARTDVDPTFAGICDRRGSRVERGKLNNSRHPTIKPPIDECIYYGKAPSHPN